jgi:subtilisin family serine protease
VSDLIAAIDWVTARAGTIESVNMSLGATGTSELLRTAIRNSVAAGVVHVAAAGNGGTDIYGRDGVFNTGDDTIPAAYPEDGIPLWTGCRSAASCPNSSRTERLESR